MTSESVLVVWLDEIRWFLEDMNLTEFALVSLGKKRRCSKRAPGHALPDGFRWTMRCCGREQQADLIFVNGPRKHGLWQIVLHFLL
mmetsp:Transcript_26401/g.57768  ORF Transcript_26401/g.57768 Transcript_26401/m.57768 type:complete len:86 (-) Transcript_26401:248-505(-)